MGVQTGVLSLLCLLVFYGWYAVWSLRLYAFRKLNTQTEAFGIAALIGSIGYMISGISNDSMVVTAPVFWGMIALGLTANVLVAKSRAQDALQTVSATTLQTENVATAQETKAESSKHPAQKKKAHKKNK